MKKQNNLISLGILLLFLFSSLNGITIINPLVRKNHLNDTKTDVVRNQIKNMKMNSVNSLKSLNSMNLISINATETETVRSNITLQVTTNITVTKTDFYNSFNYQSESILNNSFTIKIPNTGIYQVPITYYFSLYNASNYNLQNYTLNLLIDNGIISVLSIPSAGKLLPNSPLNILYSVKPLGINWRWDLNNIITNQYSSNPVITTPGADGSYRLVLIITNLLGEQQNPLTFNYYIDGTAPPLTPLIDLSSWLPAGTTIPFSNTTDFDHKFFNFTFVGSNVYTTSFPTIVAPAGNYSLWASVHDELGNTRTQIFSVHAKIGILNIAPNQAGKPGQQMRINLSETPDVSNYQFFFSNNSLYYENSTPPKLPDRIGNYVLKITLRDTIGNWLNTSYNIKVDNIPPKFLSVTPSNNSIIYDITTPISLSYNETLANFIYTFDGITNSSSNGIIYLPNPANYYNITIYASDLALNWITTHLSYYRYYKPSITPLNATDIFPNASLALTLNFPYDKILIHWDNNATNSSLNFIPGSSGEHKLNVTIINGNIISTTFFMYFVKVFITYIYRPLRVKSNNIIPVIFSEVNAIYSYKWETDTLWRFGTIYTPSSEGTHLLTVQMTTKDYTRQYSQTFTFYIDNTPPTITSIVPLTTLNNPTVTHSGKNITIQFSDLNCIGNCISSVKYYWNDISNLTTVNNFNNNNASLGRLPINTSLSTYMNLTVILTDYANNTKQFNYKYIIDDFPPVLFSSIPDTIKLPFDIFFNISEQSSVNITIRYTNINKIISNTFNLLRSFSYNPQIYGNNSLEIYISLTDPYNNTKTYFFTTTTIDSANKVKVNTLKLVAGAQLNFSVSKPIYYQRINIYLENGTLFKTLNNLNSTFPSIHNYEGPVNISYCVEDYQQSWLNKSVILIFDSIAPRIEVTAWIKVNNTYINQEAFYKSQINNVISNQTIYVNITDRYGARGTLHYEYIQNTNNRPMYDYNITNQTYLQFYLPTNTSSGEFSFYLTDDYGNVLDFSMYFNIVNIQTNKASTPITPPSPDYTFPLIISLSVIGVVSIFGYLNRDKIIELIKKREKNE